MPGSSGGASAAVVSPGVGASVDASLVEAVSAGTKAWSLERARTAKVSEVVLIELLDGIKFILNL